jgi:DMSO/TMAO reductase YedYZ molybdopterin-dependent catalytic subunit
MNSVTNKKSSRRDWIRGTAAAAWTLAQSPGLFSFAPQQGQTPIPFLDSQPIRPDRPMVQWDQLRNWVTPVSEFFTVAHYGFPETQAAGWRLDVSGLVEKSRSLSLEELKKRPRREYTATLECSGNGSSPGFLGGIGNARWTGTPLAPILQECGIKPEGIEVVFFGVDQGTEKIRGKDYPQNFGRSLAIQDAAKDTVLVAYEMNGEPLDAKHGGPLRLIVPGWYGIAWVKWMNRIEVHDRRFMSRFMGRDYVTIRGEQRGDQVIWREMSVGKMNLKSIVASVMRLADGRLRIAGAAWNDGTPLKAVELKIDDGPWIVTQIGEGAGSDYCWKFWSYDWKDAAAGEHTLVSRAIDARGIQPAATDPAIAMKRTYWEANQQYPRKIKI